MAVLIGGAVLSAAAAGFAAVGERRETILEHTARPYQTQGYVPGYVPGYITGQVPGYGVPGYIPGYGFFRQLSGPQFRDEFKAWVKENFRAF